MDRPPSVSGFFYPSERRELEKMLDDFYTKVPEPEGCPDPLGVVVPHAGFIYSGLTAMHSYKALRKSGKRRIVIIGPNHSSSPPYAAVYPEGAWTTPLGSVSIDSHLSENIARGCTRVKIDERAHSVEHSVEVQIPFLQYVLGDFSFSPIVLGDQSESTATEIGDALNELGEDVLIVASSDLTHYESESSAEKKDHELISAIESLDVPHFYDLIGGQRISACGFGAIAVLMRVTKLRGAKLSLLDYRTSGETSKDWSSVVGYASMCSCL